jgi:hypothetical protein
MPIYYLPFSIFITSLIGVIYPLSLWLVLIISFGISIYTIKKIDKSKFKPKSKEFKEIEKIKKNREKIEIDKYKIISDQLEYINLNWGYNKEQEKIIDKFLLQKAYKNLYNSLNASLIPQIIKMIDSCNEKNKKGCKREVSKRINDLIKILKDEINYIKKNKKDEFDITLEVYDRLKVE